MTTGRAAGLIASLGAAMTVMTGAAFPGPDRASPHTSPARDPWTAARVMTPEQLARQLSDPKAPRALVVCVGFRFLYDGAHVPGSVYIGPGRESKGIEALREWARRARRDQEVVLYCGCCPWSECPNIRPAFRVLSAMRFTRLKVLQIDNSFARDWVAKGFPTEKGGT